jgi:type VII secretion integral membrane protein EccD
MNTLIVAGPAGRVALRVPPSVTVADLLSEALAAVGGELDTTSRWLLARPAGDALDPERTVGQLGLMDGSLLVIRPAVEAEAESLSEDLPEAVGSVLESAHGQWSVADVGTLGAGVAVVAVLAASLAVFQANTPMVRLTTSLAAGLAVLLAGAISSRTAGLTRLGRWAAMASLALWAIGGAAAASSFPSDVLAAAAIGVLIGSLAIWFTVEGATAPALGAAFAAAIFGVGDAITVPAKAPLVVAAGIVAAMAVLAVGMLPKISVQMAGILEIDSAAGGAKRSLERSVAAGRDILAWLVVGDAVLLGGAVVVLAWSGGPYAYVMAAVIAIAAALQARHHGFRREAAPLMIAALVGLGALEVALAVHYAPASMLAVIGTAAALADVGAAMAVVSVAGRFSSSVDSRRWFGWLEFVANAAVIPLLLGLVGVYEFVFTQAKRLL